METDSYACIAAVLLSSCDMRVVMHVGKLIIELCFLPHAFRVPELSTCNENANQVRLLWT